MIKINSFYWNLYKSSSEGQNAINKFQKLAIDGDTNLIIDFVKEYNPEHLLNCGEEELYECFQYNLIPNSLATQIKTTTNPRPLLEEFIKAYDSYWILSYIIPLSFELYKLNPEYFVPYMFFTRFQYFQQVIDDFDLDLNEKIPGEGDKEKRILFYLDICDELYKYRRFNNMSSAELCAAIYDMERKAYDSDLSQDSTSYPRVWWIVGAKSPKESASKTLFFQGNKEMRKGDIAVFYEKTDTYCDKSLPKDRNPKQSITGIWTIQNDGNIDPFFWFYRCCIISNEVKVKPLKFSTFSKDPLTCNIHGVSAHMQNYSGREISVEDYELILQAIEKYDSSFDRRKVPAIYSSGLKVKTPYNERGDMKPEKWVEENLIKPLLERMGWGHEPKDYRTQVYLQLGRKKDDNKIKQSGRPDFSVFPFGENRQCADIVIEAKGPGEMDGKKLRETFDQGESYASRQYAELLVLSDDKQLLLYKRTKDGNFKFTNTPFAEFSWEALLDENEKKEFTRLYNIFLKFQKHKPQK